MVQLLIQVDEDIAEQLEVIAPGKSRKRSEFIRLALRKALMEVGDSKTRRAYARHPDHEPVFFDASVWGGKKRSKK